MKIAMILRPFIIIIFTSVVLSLSCSAFEKEELRIPYYRQKADDTAAGYIERLKYLDSIAQCKGKQEKAHIYYEMGELAFKNFDYPLSAQLYEKAFEKFSTDSVRMRSLAASYVSKSWYRQYEYKETLKWSNAVLKIAKPDSLLWIDMNELAALSGVVDRYHLSTLFSELLIVMEKRLKKLNYSEASPDRKALGAARYYNTLGNYLNSRANFENALEAYIHAAELTNDSNTNNTAMINIGNAYCNMGKPEMGRPILEEAVKHKCAQQLIAAIDLCNAYILLQMPDSAESVLVKYIDTQIFPKESALTHFPYVFRSEIASLRGDYKEAYHNVVDGFIILRDAFYEGDFLFAGEIDRSIRETADVGSQNKWYKRLGVFGWALILLLLLQVLCIYFSILIVRRRKKRVREENTRIEDKYNLLIQKNISLEAEEKLYRERCKNDNLTVENIRMREMIHSLEQKARMGKTLSSLSSEILSDIKDMKMTTNSIEGKMKLHEQTGHEFLKNLCSLHPDLTKAEREICSYIHIGFSPKEIAATTNRSIKTVNTLRHRIRSKIGIPSEISLDAYLLKIRMNNQ